MDNDNTLTWVSKIPLGMDKAAMLIPQYNEASCGKFEERLYYFKGIAERLSDIIDVIIIDDGSSDESLEIIKSFLVRHPHAFYVASIYPNSQKVGAIYKTASSINSDFVILTDFDTDLCGIEQVGNFLQEINVDPKIMGGYFRMLPFDGGGLVFSFQELEYCFARIYYSFHKPHLSVPVMPGAGSCYKRIILLDIFSKHSGLRNGEDRESTLIGLKLGYKTVYKENILALTRPPSTFHALVNQRKRWYLGYLETFIKERKYYFSQVLKFNVVGFRLMQDMGSVLLLLFLPLICIMLFLYSTHLTLSLIGYFYLLSLCHYIGLIIMDPKEILDMPKGNFFLLIIYPFFWIAVSYLAWTRALRGFFTTPTKVEGKSEKIVLSKEIVIK